MAKASTILLYLAILLIFSSDVILMGKACTLASECPTRCRVGIPQCVDGVCICCVGPTCQGDQENINLGQIL
uniref:Uncharacterized protein n=1 Tax=Solanum lycopersicum TaxID=4081 RepID=A0A3Q7GF65_SOLLC